MSVHGFRFASTTIDEALSWIKGQFIPAGWRDFDLLAEWDDEQARKELEYA
jgi:hypothetical protein